MAQRERKRDTYVFISKYISFCDGTLEWDRFWNVERIRMAKRERERKRLNTKPSFFGICLHWWFSYRSSIYFKWNRSRKYSLLLYGRKLPQINKKLHRLMKHFVLSFIRFFLGHPCKLASHIAYARCLKWIKTKLHLNLVHHYWV